MHSDLVQALGKIPVDVKGLGLDMATVSSHKIYGPKAVGAVYVRGGIRLRPLLYGGHQEHRVRPGTENPAGIIGFARAMELVLSDMDQGVMDRVEELRDMLEQEILKRIPHIRINGGGASRVPNTLNVTFGFVEGEGLALMLDAQAIAVSTGSACSSGTLEPSHVLIAMGMPHELAHGSIRFSLGRMNTSEEIMETAQKVARVVEQLRSMSPLYEDFTKSGMDFGSYLVKVGSDDEKSAMEE